MADSRSATSFCISYATKLDPEHHLFRTSMTVWDKGMTFVMLCGLAQPQPDEYGRNWDRVPNRSRDHIQPLCTGCAYQLYLDES